MQKYADKGPTLMPRRGVDEALRARQVQVVADGGCDAMVCGFREFVVCGCCHLIFIYAFTYFTLSTQIHL